MNAIINKLLLAGEKFTLEMHLRQPGFTYSACDPFIKNKKRIKKFKDTGDSRYIYQNELDKACLQRDVVYGDFKDLNRRATADKVLHDKASNFDKKPKYDRYQRRLASMVYTFFDKKTSGAVATLANKSSFKNEIISNYLTKDLDFYHVLFIFIANMHRLFL